MFNNERDIINYLEEKWGKLFPNRHLVGFNVPIYGCLSNKRIGLADIVFTRGSKKYVVEVKFDKSNESGDFWDSLKVLGYVASLRLCNFAKDIIPLIMINKDILSYDKRAILSELGIGYITFTIINDSILFDDGF